MKSHAEKKVTLKNKVSELILETLIVILTSKKKFISSNKILYLFSIMFIFRRIQIENI